MESDNVCMCYELESKDESNIKRRVYDALNVMVASEILRRDGRLVFADSYRGHKGQTKRNEVDDYKE